ncbi:glycoside hydrolase family 5 protein [Actinoallomurus sp. CA-150999]|uniref:glycoside hydrolase family 5 protein n=1 Tax=Actinoallomurus sp. CA-150999 TaxID=3239887 RepID=UPI003D8B1178
MSQSSDGYLRAAGPRFLDPHGAAVQLRGVGIGGWLNMENFVTGYAGTESLMRAAVRRVLGQERYESFFDRLLTGFFDDADARFLAAAGLNAVRIPIHYHHFEDDARPFEIKEEGFRHLDRVIDLCGRQGIYSVIDLHALPGWQNQRWHSDNPTHLATFWQHRHFQDRVVRLWEAIADRYKDDRWVAGYNPVNEPADESRQVVGPFYRRLVEAIRAVDPHHTLFLDGNTYSTEFDVFDVFDEPPANTVYVCHDYAMAGLAYGGPYPGRTRGVWQDRDVLEKKFLQRTEFARELDSPIWVGEFGPIYSGDPAVDEQRGRILADQLDIYRRYEASWSLWTYKDIGLQGVVYASPDSPYMQRFADFVAKKKRLGADAWGSDGTGPAEVTQAVQDLIAREFPGFDPYPWGRWDFVRTLLLTITVAQPLVEEYAALFEGLGDDELVALADSFALANCVVREPLRTQIAQGPAAPNRLREADRP